MAVNENLKVVRDSSEFRHRGDEFYGVDRRRRVEELDTVVDEIDESL
jgi:hypothetical protein